MQEILPYIRISFIPSNGGILRELNRARTPQLKVRVWSRSLNPMDSISQLLSITVGRNTPLEGIDIVQVDGIRSSEVWAIVSSLRHALVALPRDDELNSNGWK